MPAATHNLNATSGITRRTRKLSWRKKLGFTLLIFCALAAFTELVSNLTLKFVSKLSFEEIRSNRLEANAIVEVTDLLPAEVSHPYVGWTRNPDAKRPDLFEGRKYEPNEFGLMDTVSPLQKRAPGKVIIGVIGGSVGWQMTVTGQDFFLKELQRQPRFQGKEVQLLRLAVSGYKQPQQLMLLTYLISLGAEFDALVNIDGYNEVVLHAGENALAGVFFAYPRAWKVKNLSTVNPRQIRLTANLITTKERRRAWTRFFSAFPMQESATVNFMWLMIDSRFARIEQEYHMEMIQGRLEKPGYHVLGPRHSFKNSDEMFHRLTDYWAQCSRQIQQICHDNDIEYHHVLPPNQHLKGSKPIVDPEERRIALLDSHVSQAAVVGYPLLVAEGAKLKSSGLQFHDLTQLFSQSPQPIYIDDCCHYNPEGNQRLATAVAEILNRGSD